MNICLVNPPIEDFYTTGIRRQPLGLLYIASALKSEGYSPFLINCHTKKRGVMNMPHEFSYLEKYRSTGSTLKFPFANYTHYGMSWQETEKRIRETKAGLYLVSSMFTTYFEETGRIISMIKNFSPSSIVAAGGHHASLYPRDLLERGADYVISGEGEIPSLMLAQMIQHGGSPVDVPNLSWLEQGALRRSGREIVPDIERLHMPERGLLAASSMKGYGKTFISMIASRGCPNNCSFCTSRIVWGDSHRKRGSADIIDEINHCVDRYNAAIINFEDDNLFPSRGRAVDLLEAVIRERESKPFYPELTAMNGISIEKLDNDILLLMKRAGFRELNISLVSHSPEVQRSSGRPFDSGQFMKIASSAVAHGFNVRGYFILGLPGQSVAEVNETISFMKKLGISLYPSVYYNVHAPASEWKMQRSSAFFNERPDFSRDDLVACFSRCS